MARSPGIVAELGRPETPEETAARKVESSRKHRANQTALNLVLALGASLGILLILVLVVVRPDLPAREPVDYIAVAEQAQGAVEVPLASPILPPLWTSNSATLETESGGITKWSIGFLTPDTKYLGFRQGIDANETWLANQLESSRETGSTTIEGVTWALYDNREQDDPGNLAYAMSTTVNTNTYVLYGTADGTDFETLASALAEEIRLGEGTP